MKPLTALLALLLALPAVADERDRLKVGLQPDGRIVVPTNQILQPAGKQVTFPGRPVDLLLIEDGKTLVAKNMREPRLHRPRDRGDQADARPAAAKGLAGAFSAVGLVAARRPRLRHRLAGRRSASPSGRPTASIAWDGGLRPEGPGGRRGRLPDRAGPPGRRSPVGLRVARQRAAVDEPEPRARSRPASRSASPRTCRSWSAAKVYVSNWGGDHPGKDDATHKTSGTPVKTDPRTSVANHGSVSVVTKAGDGLEADEDDRRRRAPERDGREPGRQVRLRRQREQRHGQRHRHRDGRRWSRRSTASRRQAAVRHRVERGRAQPRRPHAVRRQRHRQLRRGRPPRSKSARPPAMRRRGRAASSG